MRRVRALATLLLAAALLPPAVAAAELPLATSDQGHLLVDGELNGRPARFVLDTAASHTVLTPGAVATHRLAPVDGAGVTVTGTGGTAQKPVYAVDAIGAGGRRLENRRIAMLPMASALGEDVAGVLGADWLRLAVPEFDFAGGRLTLHEPASLPALRERLAGEGFVATPFRINRAGLILVRLDVGRGLAFGVLDTGARASVFNWKAAALAGLSPGDPRVSAGEGMTGADGRTIAAATGPVGAVGSGDVRFGELSPTIADLAGFEVLGLAGGPAVLLGLDPLTRKARLVIDYPAKLLWFR